MDSWEEVWRQKYAFHDAQMTALMAKLEELATAIPNPSNWAGGSSLQQALRHSAPVTNSTPKDAALGRKPSSIYVVVKGQTTDGVGIYPSYQEALQEVHGVSGVVWQKVATHEERWDFIQEYQ